MQARTAIVEPVRWGQNEERIDCDAEDTAYASFATAAGMTGEMTASWAGRGGGTMPGTGDVYYTSRGRVSGDEVTLEDGSTAILADLYEKECPADRKAHDFPLGFTDTFALAQHEWLQAVGERRPPETSGRDAMTSLACAFAVLESAQARRRVDVEEVLNGSLEDYQQAINENYGIA